MPKLDFPLLLSPVFKPKIWGRLDLAPIYPSAKAASQRGAPALERLRPKVNGPIGEAWVTDHASTIANGPAAGMTLGEAVKLFGEDLCGRLWSEPRFPVLAKFIWTSDWLSVQVHPDDEYARAHEPGSTGKCEMWFVLEAGVGAEILLGLKPGTTWEAMKTAFDKGRSREVLRPFHPRVEEAIFVPPGTVHALGPGLVFFEVEQNSDITYRLDDFGRVGLDGKPRPLHQTKGLEVARLNHPPLRSLAVLQFREPFGARRYVLACPHFALEALTLKRPAHFRSEPDRVEAFCILEGEGRWETGAGWMNFRRGEAWLVPPATGAYRAVPQRQARMLKFYVPDLDRDFRKPLARHGLKPPEIRQIVFDRGRDGV